MKTELLVFSAFLIAPLAYAEPIYKCKDSNGNVVFQQAACTADKLNSLADTAASESFRRDEEQRMQREAKQQAELRERTEQAERDRTERARLEVESEESRVKDEKLSIDYLKLCMDGDIDCSIDSVSNAVTGMTMGALEGVLGEGREQRIQGQKLYYYPVSVKGRTYTLQVKYEVNFQKRPGGGQVGNVVSEVNYY